jgi:hypothetical protein
MGNGEDLAAARDEKLHPAVSDQNWRQVEAAAVQDPAKLRYYPPHTYSQ